MIFVGSIEEKENSMPRVLPYCLYINVNLCKQHEISFFNENFMHGLTSSFSNKYDTGAYFYKEAKELLTNHEIYEKMSKASNPYGDGHASKRIVDAIIEKFS